MNNSKHVVVIVLVFSAFWGGISIAQNYEDEVQVKSTSSSDWGSPLVPLWSDQSLRGENFQFGPILIILLSILCAYAFLNYFHKKEALSHEY